MTYPWSDDEAEAYRQRVRRVWANPCPAYGGDMDDGDEHADAWCSVKHVNIADAAWEQAGD